MRKLWLALFLLALLSNPVEAAENSGHFCVSAEALERAMELSRESQERGQPQSWIRLLALASARSGVSAAAIELVHVFGALEEGESEKQILNGKESGYPVWLDMYSALLGGIEGYYAEESTAGWKPEYGIKAFSPIAAGYWYIQQETTRQRGRIVWPECEIIAMENTPVVAIESGEVETLMRDRHDGWTIGIRTGDKRRCYYYTHLREETPFAAGLSEGKWVEAGEVIGFLGCSGCLKSSVDANGSAPRLCLRLMLFPKGEAGPSCWADIGPIVRLLDQNQSTVICASASGTWKQVTRNVDLNGKPIG